MAKASRKPKEQEPWEQPDRPYRSSQSNHFTGQDGFCPYCGRHTQGDFVFCPQCGRRLE